MTAFLAPASAMLVTFLATYSLANGWMGKCFQDTPNERSLHILPIPRSGGIAIAMGLLVGWGCLLFMYGMPQQLLWVIAAAAAVAVVSLLDDLHELPARIRLPVHMLAALFLLLGGVTLPWGVTGWIVTFFAVVWMINLYNFMDGMDGFAGGMTLFGFAFLGGGGYLAGDALFALLCWTVAAAAAGFLLFNFPPARIFMGDAGSATLGTLTAGLSLWGIHDGLFPVWFPLLVFSAFIVDATVTLIRRGLRGEKVWQAHREHFYQRLVQAGWGHRKTVLFEYGLMIVTGGCAVVMLDMAVVRQIWLLMAWLGVYLLLAYMVDRYYNRQVALRERRP